MRHFRGLDRDHLSRVYRGSSFYETPNPEKGFVDPVSPLEPLTQP